jgi:dTDP-4-amino-4,6-dideoxygalactose transaminase
MSQFDQFQSIRTQNAKIWTDTLTPLSDLVELPSVRPEVTHSWHLYPLRLKPEALEINRDKFIMALKALNIGTSVMFIPIHYHSCYQKWLDYTPEDLIISENFFRQEVSLPLAPAHSPEIIQQAANLTAKLLQKFAR